MLPTPTWFVGCGNMAGAMVEGWRSAGIDLSGAVVIRPSGRPVEGLRTVPSVAEAVAPATGVVNISSNGNAGGSPRLVILGFKPQQLNEAAPELARWVAPGTVVVSILAGVEVATLRERFPNAGAIVRALPNLPVAVRRGVVALYSDDADENAREMLSQLFAPLGFALWANSEASLAAIGSVAGAGPAYVARFVDALAKAGTERGLSRELAGTIALETVLGTAWMAATTGEGMDALARRVASPKGTTEAGLAVLDTEQVLDKLVALTVAAAARRGAELAEEARSAKLADQPSLP
ncbi:MAG TPA: pyrroline-5-carboxylate reductase dimerization domain-containing protein [Sphingomicrobium sp.]|nr:pyrroline-5-carboxylate reductase dimerization domain-containing protein [Sphingomicrobium sp.]